MSPNSYWSGLFPVSCPWNCDICSDHSWFCSSSKEDQDFSRWLEKWETSAVDVLPVSPQKGLAGVCSWAGTILMGIHPLLFNPAGVGGSHLLGLFLCFIPRKVFRAAGYGGSCVWNEHGAGMQEGGGCDVLALFSGCRHRFLWSPWISDCCGSTWDVPTAPWECPGWGTRRRDNLEWFSLCCLDIPLRCLPFGFLGVWTLMDPSEESMILFLLSCELFSSSIASSKFSCCSSQLSFG